MKLRTLREAHAALLEADPGCCLTMTALRRLVITGDLPSVRAGQKYLVDLDQLEASLFGPKPGTLAEAGRVRPVEVRL